MTPDNPARHSGEPSIYEHQSPPHRGLLINGRARRRSGLDGVSPYHRLGAQAKHYSSIDVQYHWL